MIKRLIPALILFLLPQVAMAAAPTYVRNLSVGNSGVTSLSGGFSAGTTSGDAILVFIGSTSDSVTVSSLVDAPGNTYNLALGPIRSAGQGSVWIYWAKNITGGANGTATNITLTMSGSSTLIMIAHAVHPSAAGAIYVDVTGSGSGNGVTATTNGLVTTVANAYVFMGVISRVSTSASWTDATARAGSSSSALSRYTADKSLAATTTYTPTVTLTTGQWVMGAVSFSDTAPAGGATRRRNIIVSHNLTPPALFTAPN